MSPGKSFRTGCGNSPFWVSLAARRCRPATSDKSCSAPPNSVRRAFRPRSPRSWSICPTISGCWCGPASAGHQGRSAKCHLASTLESPAGFAFQTGQMVISNHLHEETRFRTPKLLSDHGIRRAINVLIARGGEGHLPFGVLEVDSPEPGQFDVADADFLAGFAGLLGIAIERQHADADLREALDHQAMLTREMSHRVKNSLASVVGLLRVQSRSAQSEEVRNARLPRSTTIYGAAPRSGSSTSPTSQASFAGSCRRRFRTR
jgi:GAF domain-containing protein